MTVPPSRTNLVLLAVCDCVSVCACVACRAAPGAVRESPWESLKVEHKSQTKASQPLCGRRGLFMSVNVVALLRLGSVSLSVTAHSHCRNILQVVSVYPNFHTPMVRTDG